MLIFIPLYFVALIILLLLWLIFKQSEIFIKLLYLNSLANYVVVFIALMSSFEFYNSYLDVALIYLLLNFIANKAFLTYFTRKIRDQKIGK